MEIFFFHCGWVAKILITFLASLVVAIVSKISGMTHDDAHQYVWHHVEYFTCGTTVAGTVIASGTITPVFTTWYDYGVKLIILISQVVVTVTITFVLTKFLKWLWPDKVIIEKSVPIKDEE